MEALRDRRGRWLSEKLAAGELFQVPRPRVLPKRWQSARSGRCLGAVQPVGAQVDDRGIDGALTFTDTHGDLQTVLVSVKSGHVNSAMVRDLKGTIEREKAALGLFVTLEESTKEMRLGVDTAGVFHSKVWNRDYPKIQIRTINDLLNGLKPQLPPFVLPTYQQAERIPADPAGEQQTLFGA